MRDEKGITLIALIITVILMIILAYVGIQYGGNSMSSVELQNFSYQLQQIQGRVDAIHEKMLIESEPNYIYLDDEMMGVNIGYSAKAVNTLNIAKKINYNTASGSDEELYYEGRDAYYRYFSKSDLENILDIKNPKLDVIINFKTREVISVKGQEYNGKTYYSLEDIQN